MGSPLRAAKALANQQQRQKSTAAAGSVHDKTNQSDLESLEKTKKVRKPAVTSASCEILCLSCALHDTITIAVLQAINSEVICRTMTAAYIGAAISLAITTSMELSEHFSTTGCYAKM